MDTHTEESGRLGGPACGVDSRPERWSRRVAMVATCACAALLVGELGAQQSDRPRPAGRYTVVGGMTLGSHANSIYVLDAANRELIALRWNDSRRELEGVGYRDLVADLARGAER